MPTAAPFRLRMEACTRHCGTMGAIWSAGLLPMRRISGAGADAAGLVWSVMAAMLVPGSSHQPAMARRSVRSPLHVLQVGGRLIASLVTGQFMLGDHYALIAAAGASASCVPAWRWRSIWPKTAMQEKSEVVSMLLREFEEEQADWLWQIDTSAPHCAACRRASLLRSGLNPEKSRASCFLELISGDGWERAGSRQSLHDLADKLKRRENFSNLTVKVSIGGQTRWWELSGTPIVDELASIPGFPRGRFRRNVTEQRESSRKDRLPGALRYADAAAEPAMLNEGWAMRCEHAAAVAFALRADDDRSRPVQGGQRLAGTSGRRPHAGEGRGAAEEPDARRRGLRSAGRRRVRRGAARSVRSRTHRPAGERYHPAIVRALPIDNHLLYVGASVGSAVGPRDGRTVEELLRNADLALYRSKGEGGGEHFEYEPRCTPTRRNAASSNIRCARRWSATSSLLHYQPVVDAKTEEVVSFEALLRWNSSRPRLRQPGQVHAAGRRYPPHRAHRHMGHGTRARGRATGRRAYQGQRQCLARAAARKRFRRQSGARVVGKRARSQAARDRGDRGASSCAMQASHAKRWNR